MIPILFVDLETYSGVDLRNAGVYAYAAAEDFEILMLAYAYDNGPVEIVDLTCQDLPERLAKDLQDVNVQKSAFNAQFERVCLSRHFGKRLSPASWNCSMVLALEKGLPGNLDGVAKALGLDEQKDSLGKALIRTFSIPCKPTKTNGGRTRNLPVHMPEKWEMFLGYCKQDVEVERSIRKHINDVLPIKEQQLYVVDQIINDTGVGVDKQLVENAIELDAQYRTKLLKEAMKLTGLENPNSRNQLLEWLNIVDESLELTTLTKKDYPGLLASVDDEKVKRVIEIRQELSKTSVTKYKAMQRALLPDSRVKGLLQFYGASRTGRWAGRLVQVQNLPQNKMSDLDLARRLLKDGAFDEIEFLYDSVPTVLSQLIRTAFVADTTFIVSDFSAIEARVIAWLSGEKWRQEVFSTHGKIYEASASQMFKVPLEKVDKELRSKGKIAELALGYQGGVRALETMGGKDMGLTEQEMVEIVTSWRAANRAIQAFWQDVENAAHMAIRKQQIELQYGLTFYYEPVSDTLRITLPSGRELAYYKPRIAMDDRFSREALCYEGNEAGQWKRVNTYGGKLVENIVQAVARDCLAESLLAIHDAGYKIVMHVHDEVVVEKGDGSLAEVIEIMGRSIPWAKGLLLTADAYETKYYRKD